MKDTYTDCQLRIRIIHVIPTFHTSGLFSLYLSDEQLMNDQLPVVIQAHESIEQNLH